MATLTATTSSQMMSKMTTGSCMSRRPRQSLTYLKATQQPPQTQTRTRCVSWPLRKERPSTAPSRLPRGRKTEPEAGSPLEPLRDFANRSTRWPLWLGGNMWTPLRSRRRARLQL